jgi:hypothetical protein
MELVSYNISVHLRIEYVVTKPKLLQYAFTWYFKILCSLRERAHPDCHVHSLLRVCSSVEPYLLADPYTTSPTRS